MSGADIDIDCPVNTTECLLIAARQILAELREIKDEYNWDPLTFGGTLIIGIVALFFAGLTIAQGLLAAGPGRHKCSSYAIGTWARLTKRHFDWEELRFRTVAFTPIIRSTGGFTHPAKGSKRQMPRSATLQTFMEKYLPVPLLWGLAHFGVVVEPYARVWGAEGKSLDEYFPATWLALLACLGMDNPHHWEVKATGADYIPTDLAATPAHGCIMDLVALSVAAVFPLVPEIAIDKDSKLPSVRSEDLILEFRQHPLLGLVGTIQTHKPRHIGKHFGDLADVKDHTAQAMVHLKGFLRPSVNMIGDNPDLAAQCIDNVRDSPSLAQNVEVQLQEFVKFRSGKGIDEEHACCDPLSAEQFPSCRILELRRSLSFKAGHHIPLLPLVLAEVPKALPIVFPSLWNRTAFFLVSLLPQSRFWLLSRKAFQELDQKHRSKSTETLQERPLEWISARTSPGHGLPQLELRQDVFDVSLSSIDVRSVDDTRSSIHLTADTRGNILSEIRAIDNWLSRSGAQGVAFCRLFHIAWTGKMMRCLRQWDIQGRFTTNLKPSHSPPNGAIFRLKGADFERREFRTQISTTYEHMKHFQYMYGKFCNTDDGHEYGVLDEIIKSLLVPLLGFGRVREIGDVLLKETKKLESLWIVDGPNETSKNPETASHPLDDLLIYRIILMELLFSTAVDTSFVLENELCKAIVPIL